MLAVFDSGTDWAPIIVAVGALLFSVFSFWWIYARRGKITVAAPTTYAATTQQDKLIVLFPLAFYNTGPVGHVVRDLRIKFADAPATPPLDWERIRTTISPSHGELTDLSSAFPVPGRSAVKVFCEFERRPTGRAIVASTYPLTLEAVIGKKDAWRQLLEFDWHVNADAVAKMPGAFVSFRNRA